MTAAEFAALGSYAYHAVWRAHTAGSALRYRRAQVQALLRATASGDQAPGNATAKD
jgi:hypothetical protein